MRAWRRRAGVHPPGAAILVHIVMVIGGVKLALYAALIYLNGGLRGAIAQAALKGAHGWSVWSRYHTCKHHRPVTFRARRSFNFNEAEISGEGLWHVLLA